MALPRGLVAERTSYEAFARAGRTNEILPKNSCSMLRSFIRFIPERVNESQSSDQFDTVGACIIPWTFQTARVA